MLGSNLFSENRENKADKQLFSYLFKQLFSLPWWTTVNQLISHGINLFTVIIVQYTFFKFLWLCWYIMQKYVAVAFAQWFFCILQNIDNISFENICQFNI